MDHLCYFMLMVVIMELVSIMSIPGRIFGVLMRRGLYGMVQHGGSPHQMFIIIILYQYVR